MGPGPPAYLGDGRVVMSGGAPRGGREAPGQAPPGRTSSSRRAKKINAHRFDSDQEQEQGKTGAGRSTARHSQDIRFNRSWSWSCAAAGHCRTVASISSR